MTKVGIIGAGHLGTIVAEAIKEGKAPECELVGIASRSLGVTPQDLIAKGAQIIVEASKPAALKEMLVPILEAGVSVIPLSTGAFADAEFTEAVKQAARKGGSKVYLPHGAEGAFDLAATYSLVPGAKGTIVQYLIPKEHRSGTYMEEMPVGYRGPALEGFALKPSHLNVVIESAMAIGGFDKAFFEVREPEDGKAGFALELENDYATAVMRACAKPGPNMHTLIAYSAVSMLNRLTQPITF
ncbi:MAG: hypothetical protein HUJ80_06435 [Firmicutes bacterium]|nr:hypothetical protein [Bacillota bacterium]